MTPAERAVIEAARAYALQTPAPPNSILIEAVLALDAEREAPASAELDTTWGLVVAEDEVWNEKTRRWYAVEKVWREGPNVKAVLTGPGAIPARPASREVRVRRSAMGRAMDVWCEVLASS